MKNSIKNRLVKNFMLIILITVIVIEIVLIGGIRRYYYKSIEDILINQIEFSIGYSLKYLSLGTIEDMVVNDVDLFWQNTKAQVQIFDEKGDLVMDSIGMSPKEVDKTSDIYRALSGDRVTSVSTSSDGEAIMSVTKGIGQDDNMLGVVRFITSLEETNNLIRNIVYLLLGVGGIVILISGGVAFILANSIVKPLNKITKIAGFMAEGNLNIRSDIVVPYEIGQLGNTLNYMADEILKKEEIKNDFISSISHELRTPLTSIKGWAITLQDEDIEEEILLDGLNIIETESERLNIMVEELLDFSRFVSGRITLNRDQVYINSVINSVYMQLIPRAKSLGVDFTIDLKKDYLILGDVNRIKQVLINVLDNSFKFIDDRPRVSIKTSENQKPGLISVIIEDNGIGISTDEIDRVKEKFYKGKTSRSNSGIGLSIADEIMKLHNGNLLISSKLAYGTQVILEFPIYDEVV